jgi:hypothetical protein
MSCLWLSDGHMKLRKPRSQMRSWKFVQRCHTGLTAEVLVWVEMCNDSQSPLVFKVFEDLTLLQEPIFSKMLDNKRILAF